MTIHDEFVCDQCGRLIYSLPPRDPPPTRCGACEWLNEYRDPVEREHLRELLDPDAGKL